MWRYGGGLRPTAASASARTYALAREAEILGGAGYLYTEKAFPRSFELFEISSAQPYQTVIIIPCDISPFLVTSSLYFADLNNGKALIFRRSPEAKEV